MVTEQMEQSAEGRERAQEKKIPSMAELKRQTSQENKAIVEQYEAKFAKFIRENSLDILADVKVEFAKHKSQYVNSRIYEKLKKGEYNFIMTEYSFVLNPEKNNDE